MTSALGHVLIDGTPVDPADAVVSVFDAALLRGYGCFESLRSYHGVAFRQREHLDRLDQSAASLGIRLPSRKELDRWVADRAAEGDCAVKVVATGGIESGEGSGRLIVFAQPLPPMDASVTLLPIGAPWHPDGAVSELTGAKTLSYGPNMAARARARAAGFGDALLIGRSGRVLEGPTNSVAWVTDGVIETPALDLGILASITRSAAIDVAEALGIDVREGRFGLDRLLDADEVLALSTFREIQPVVGVGDVVFTVGPVTAKLQDEFRQLVARETRS